MLPSFFSNWTANTHLSSLLLKKTTTILQTKKLSTPPRQNESHLEFACLLDTMRWEVYSIWGSCVWEEEGNVRSSSWLEPSNLNNRNHSHFYISNLLTTCHHPQSELEEDGSIFWGSNVRALFVQKHTYCWWRER